MSPSRRGRLVLHRCETTMARLENRENMSMMMMVKAILLSSIISQVRQGESDEERAARQLQNRAHMAEVNI